MNEKIRWKENYEPNLTSEERRHVDAAYRAAVRPQFSGKRLDLDYANMGLLKARKPRLAGEDLQRCERSIGMLRAQIIAQEQGVAEANVA